MFDVSALVLLLLFSLDHSRAELDPSVGGVDVPPGVEITARESVRVPWSTKTYSVGNGPYLVEMMDVVALDAEAEPEAPPKVLRQKNRIPGMTPPELRELEILEALMLPPSDRVQVLGQRTATKSVTSSLGTEAINSTASNSVPPDPELAVGPSHVIAVVNSDYRIFSASTGAALTSATNLSTLMNSNSDCTGLFDPNAVYDEEYDRFIIGADAGGSDYCMAVSVTSNPLGTWAIYSIATDIGGFFFDYPHAGIGLDALYVGSNQFFDSNGNGSLSFQESRLFAIDKVAMYNLQASPTMVSWSLAGQGSSFTPQPANLHGYADGSWPTSGPHYVITDQFDSKDVNVWTVEDPFGTGTLTRQSKLDIETYTGVAAANVVDPPQVTGDDLDAGDFRVLDFEYRNGYGWTVQNVSCNPGSGTVNCVRWAQIDLAGNAIADAGVFSIDGAYTLHPDLAVNRCDDMLVGFSVSGTSTIPSAWVAGRASDDPAGTLSFSKVQQAGATQYTAFDGEPLRWGDYTGATSGPHGEGLWYLGQWSASISGRPSNWSTHFTKHVFPDSDSDGVPNSCDVCAGSDDDADSDSDGVPNGCDACEGSDDSLDTDDDGVPNGCDDCQGDDATGDSDNDGTCNDLDICSLGDDDDDADSDGVPDACDQCEGDDATGNSDGDAYCNDLDICSAGDDDDDADSDGVPDACDQCEGDDATGNTDGDAYCNDVDICADGDDDDDADSDGVPDACDQCEGDDATGNTDGDAYCDDVDACSLGDDDVDTDGDDTADACDTCTDTDNDGAGDPGFAANTCPTDNCPSTSNADQADADSDGTGDVCDTCTDTDSDGLGDPGFATNVCATDNCPGDANADQADADSDGTGDVCDTCTDTDNDGLGDPGFAANTCSTDNCPGDANPDQADADADGSGDVCDTCTDTDNDGLGDPGFGSNTCATDNCPSTSNADQADADSDGAGDACDTCTDTDSDGLGDPGFGANTCATDNCPNDANADQADADLDGIGDACDLCVGDNASGDRDSDGVCADRDCNDADGGAWLVDGCGVCGGSNACALFTGGFELGTTDEWSSRTP